MAKYRILGKLAKGGMAEVMLAEAIGREGFKKKLVIKRILPHLSGDETFVQMFLQEARLAAQLTHPNIAQIFDLGQFGEQPFISMEYVDGRNFRKVLARAAKQGQRLPLDVIVKVVAHAAEALAYAHELVGDAGPLNLIHRDVSPENIMISKGGVVKLVDFGIAKASNSSKMTQAGVVRGKASYLAPEQVLGKQLDGRADLFALAVVLFEALTGGVKPFRKTNPLDQMRAIAFEPHVPLREAEPELPEALVAIVDKGLAKAPEERWPSCRVFASELERFLVQKGSYVPAAAIAEAVNQVFVEESDLQPMTVPSEEIDGEILWTDAAPALDAPAPSDPDAIPTPPHLEEPAASEASAASSPAASSPAASSPAASSPAASSPPRKRGLLFAALGAGALLGAFGLFALLPGSPPAAKAQDGAAAGEALAPVQVAVAAAVDGTEAEPPVSAPAEPGVLAVPASPPAEPGGVEAGGGTQQAAVALPVAVEPVPAAPAATTGALSVGSNAGGEVYLDGERRGAAPQLFEKVAPGTHDVEVRLASLGLKRQGSVEVVAGEKAGFRASFGKGALVVRAKPFAKVTVDGKSYGVTPLAPISLLEGKHRVELVYDGGPKPQSRVKSVRIKARAETKVTEIFE